MLSYQRLRKRPIGLPGPSGTRLTDETRVAKACAVRLRLESGQPTANAYLDERSEDYTSDRSGHTAQRFARARIHAAGPHRRDRSGGLVRWRGVASGQWV